MNAWPSLTVRIATGCGQLYVTVVSPGSDQATIRVSLGKAGGCAACQLEGHARLASLALSRGASVEQVAEQLVGLLCHQSSPTLPSCAAAVGMVLRELDTPPGPMA